MERAAYHEAGHAVAFHVRGLGVMRVTIKPDLTDRSAGYAAPRTDLAAEPSIALDHAVACLCGPESVRRWRPERADWRLGAEGDFQRADEHINTATGRIADLGTHVLRRAAISVRAKAQAELLVRDHWGKIQAIAKELMVRITLDGDAVARLCEGAR